MVVTVGEANKKLARLKKELSGINQGIQYFSSSTFVNLKKVLEVEKLKIEEEIDEIEDKINGISIEI